MLPTDCSWTLLPLRPMTEKEQLPSNTLGITLLSQNSSKSKWTHHKHHCWHHSQIEQLSNLQGNTPPLYFGSQWRNIPLLKRGQSDQVQMSPRLPSVETHPYKLIRRNYAYSLGVKSKATILVNRLQPLCR